MAREWRLPVYPISAVTGQGVPALLEALWRGMTVRVTDADEEA
jgi:putative protein kinase ArgK-like GTPase of G3E family